MNQAQLIDGRMVSTSSEDWRAECEARYALKMDLTRRRAFIEAVEKRRGKPAADKLRASIVVLIRNQHTIGKGEK